MLITHFSSDASKPRKRGRPFKSKQPDSPRVKQSTAVPKVETPQPTTQTLPQASPTLQSPPKSTGKVKALPTVRDHTTDQVNEEGDEYVPRESDEAGEAKVTASGHLQDGREYRCRTFTVPNRGEKLFMLATECARVLVYRDSYLLFNKNKSLFKIIASQKEKDDLIQKEILPFSYRSRQIAIVSARSMYRQFGARVIQGGRRVRDDYWEQKARKQGFTEEDLASEKRPAMNRPREPVPDAVQANANAMNILASSQILYQDLPGHDIFSHLPGAGLGIGGIAPAMMPVTNGADRDKALREFGWPTGPRQEITGTPYQDRTQSSSAVDLVAQATQAAEFSRSIERQRDIRAPFLHESWNREHKALTPPPLSPESQLGQDRLMAGSMDLNGNVTPPHVRAQPLMPGVPGPPGLHTQHNRRSSSQQLVNPTAYHQQVPQAPQTPSQRSHPSRMGPGQMFTPARTPPGYSYNANSSAGMQQQQNQPTPAFNPMSNNQMWSQQQRQQYNQQQQQQTQQTSMQQMHPSLRGPAQMSPYSQQMPLHHHQSGSPQIQSLPNAAYPPSNPQPTVQPSPPGGTNQGLMSHPSNPRAMNPNQTFGNMNPSMAFSQPQAQQMQQRFAHMPGGASASMYQQPQHSPHTPGMGIGTGGGHGLGMGMGMGMGGGGVGQGGPGAQQGNAFMGGSGPGSAGLQGWSGGGVGGGGMNWGGAFSS